MTNQIDWEEIMRATEQSASAASRNSENAVGGMVKLLDRIDRHSSKLEAMRSELQNLNTLQTQCAQWNERAFREIQGGNHPSWRILALGFFASFVVGVFAGYFVS